MHSPRPRASATPPSAEADSAPSPPRSFGRERSVTPRGGEGPTLRQPLKPLVMVFCRAPVPGRTKTRLAPSLAPEGAAALSLAFLLDVVDAVRSTAWDLQVRVAESHDVRLVRALLPSGTEVAGQGDGDLGARLDRATSEALAAGRPATVCLGSDCPEASGGHVRHALAALDGGADVALCPSADGGYGLIALGRPCPEAFRGVPWSTDGVLAASRSAVEAAGRRLDLLERLDDVDRPEDLDGLARRLSDARRAPRTRRALRALGRG